MRTRREADEKKGRGMKKRREGGYDDEEEQQHLRDVGLNGFAKRFAIQVCCCVTRAQRDNLPCANYS